jgi:lipoyl(octanoyl) transferase
MTVLWTDLGRKDYGSVWALQRRLVAELKNGAGPDRLLLVEHEPVLTLGRRTDPAHILVDRAALAAQGYEVFEVERGGDVTYHGPGQLVAYPVLDLRRHRKDVRWYAETLLGATVRTAAALGVTAHPRFGAETGVWVDLPDGRVGKLAALGVRIESWVTYHGVAMNVSTDLSAFDVIVPCGLAGAPVVSLEGLLGRPVSRAAAVAAFVAAFGSAFGVATAADPGLAASPELRAPVESAEARL